MKICRFILLGCIGLAITVQGCVDDDAEDCIDANILTEHFKSQVDVIRNTASFSFERKMNGTRDTFIFTKAGQIVDSIFLFPSSLDKPCSTGGSAIIALERERFVFTTPKNEEVLDFQLVRTDGPNLLFLVFRNYILYHGVGCFLCLEKEEDYLFKSNTIKVHQLEDGLRKRNFVSVEGCFNEKSGLLELGANVPSGSASAYYSRDHGIVDFQVNINTDSFEHWVRL